MCKALYVLMSVTAVAIHTMWLNKATHCQTFLGYCIIKKFSYFHV